MNTTFRPYSEHTFLKHNGELGQLILSRDWSGSTIGPFDSWPHSLQITLANMLHSDFPQFLFWGEDLLCFITMLISRALAMGGKRPCVGKPAKTVWPEIWHEIEAMLNKVRTTGESVWFEDRLLPIFRNNELENVYWTFSYSPALGDSGSISDVLVICIETTRTVTARLASQHIVSERTKERDVANRSLREANVYLQDVINYHRSFKFYGKLQGGTR